MKKISIKSILALSCISACLIGCSNEEIPYYDSQYNAVRFSSTSEYDANDDTYKGNYSFIENPFDEYVEYDLPLMLVGNTAPEDRIVEYVIDKELTTAPDNSYEILQSLIPANSLTGVIKIKVYNTEEIRNGESYTLRLQLKGSSALGLGPKEYITATLSWSNDVVPPLATDRFKWATYNSLIQSSLAITNMTATAYSSNALKLIVTALNWNDWDNAAAHPELIQIASYYSYKYLADYRLLMLDNSQIAYAAILANYIEQYNQDHPGDPLIHNEGSMKGQPVQARKY